jgi:hypothetical protein
MQQVQNLKSAFANMPRSQDLTLMQANGGHPMLALYTHGVPNSANFNMQLGAGVKMYVKIADNEADAVGCCVITHVPCNINCLWGVLKVDINSFFFWHNQPIYTVVCPVFFFASLSSLPPSTLFLLVYRVFKPCILTH